MAADELIKEETLVSLNEHFQITTWGLIGIAIVIVSAFLILKILRVLLLRYAKRIKLDESRIKSVIQIIKYLVWVIALIICLDFLHVKVTLLLAGATALLVGVGFGMQNIFADVIGGIIILFDGSVQMDDIIKVGDIKGQVKRIKIRNTVVKTIEDFTVIVPNRMFINDYVSNYSHNNVLTRFNVQVGVAYGSDTSLVREILINCAKAHNLVSDKPKPFVRFDDYGDSALIFNLYFWSKEVFTIENIQSDLRFMIDKEFRQANITIPFPQREITISQQNVVKES